MLVNFSDRELKIINELAKALDVTAEKVVILALRSYQLQLSGITSKSPGCGIVE